MEGQEKIREIDTIDPYWTFRSCLLGNKVIKWLNRKWEVKLPPDSGTAKVIGGREKVIIDLSQATLGGAGAVRTFIVFANGELATTNIAATVPVPL